jgi:predicted aldo/keto reductase-like oxidoreductase
LRVNLDSSAIDLQHAFLDSIHIILLNSNIMKYNLLGKTGIKISELCYGALPIGPLQADFPVDKAAEIIRYSLEQGVNFIDTAQRYKTYPHIREALKGYQPPVVVASKSWAVTYEDMQKAIDEAREGMGLDTIDIFHLHAARVGVDVFAERKAALECLLDAKAKGVIRAVGISTHSVRAVRMASDVPEIDVVFPLVNLLGVGILDGTLPEMIEAIKLAADKGKGIYLMKAMAGGHLSDRFEEALNFARSVRGTDAIAVGMLTRAEVDANVAYFEGRPISNEIRAGIGKKGKKLQVIDICKGCGACAKNCPNEAITIKDGRASADPELCLLCGYCVPYCPQFALRLITPA